MPSSRKLVIPVLTLAALIGSASLLATGGSVSAPAATEDAIAWRTDVAAATAEAEETGKPLFLDFTAAWCAPCVLMQKETWVDPRVQAALAERFTPVKVNLDHDPETASKHGVVGIPMQIAYEGGEPAGRVFGYQGPEQMLAFLDLHAPAEAATP